MVRHFAEARTAVRRLAAAAAKSGGAPPRPRRARTA
jgi:hypothetical protein